MERTAAGALPGRATASVRTPNLRLQRCSSVRNGSEAPSTTHAAELAFAHRAQFLRRDATEHALDQPVGEPVRRRVERGVRRVDGQPAAAARSNASRTPPSAHSRFSGFQIGGW
jgi:hypothetical protein